MKKIFLLAVALTAMLSCSSDNGTTTAGDISAVDEVIYSRRSIRSYTDQAISREVLDQILDAGINAPNGQGRQAYEIRVVDDPVLLNEMAEAALKGAKGAPRGGASRFFQGAGAVVFIANDQSYDMSQVDCGLLGENIILSAWARGIGSCCLASPVRMMKQSEECAPYISRMGFSNGYELLYCIALGYPAESPDARPRKSDMIRYVK